VVSVVEPSAVDMTNRTLSNRTLHYITLGLYIYTRDYGKHCNTSNVASNLLKAVCV